MIRCVCVTELLRSWCKLFPLQTRFAFVNDYLECYVVLSHCRHSAGMMLIKCCTYVYVLLTCFVLKHSNDVIVIKTLHLLMLYVGWTNPRITQYAQLRNSFPCAKVNCYAWSCADYVMFISISTDAVQE